VVDCQPPPRKIEDKTMTIEDAMDMVEAYHAWKFGRFELKTPEQAYKEHGFEAEEPLLCWNSWYHENDELVGNTRNGLFRIDTKTLEVISV
jgi:hypothetical protein